MALNIMESKEWYLASYAAEGVPTTEHLKLRTVPLSLSLDSIPDAHVALQTLFISVDPYIRTRMSGSRDGLYSPQYPLNQVQLLKEEFGYDDAFNYNKEADFDAALSKYFPNGIDVYLDNVGGKMLEAVLNHVNLHARIPICGMISQYNQTWTERDGVRNLLNIVGKEVRMEGYILGSYLDRFEEFAVEMGNYIKQGKISSKIQIYEGIERFAESIASLFSSSNTGKVILELKPHPA